MLPTRVTCIIVDLGTEVTKPNQQKYKACRGPMRNMCTAVLTHFPIYTQTHSNIIQVHVPWDISQAPHTLGDMYTHIYV